MGDDREAIFSRVRAALAPLRARAPHPDYAARLIVARRKNEPDDLVERFAERIRSVNGLAVTSATEVAARLREGGWRRGYCDPRLWPRIETALGGDFDVDLEFDRERIDEYSFGITRAAGAIAETGTIILNDAVTTRRLAALAPWVHVAAVERTALHPDLHEAIASLGADPNVVWCTGPSKTADVEGILIEGVHGPGVQIAWLL